MNVIYDFISTVMQLLIILRTEFQNKIEQFAF